jgi:hypothetical protein
MLFSARNKCETGSGGSALTKIDARDNAGSRENPDSVRVVRGKACGAQSGAG